ncbi:hypothetical protein D3C76_527520 [compost metagenome]
MPQLLGTRLERGLIAVLAAQRQQAIGQCSTGAEHEIPEDHGKEALVSLPQQIALHAHQQALRFIGHQAQIALGNVQGGLIITAPPGISKRPQRRLRIAAAQAVDQHQQVYRQCQQAIGHRLQHMQQQYQHRYRRQHQNGQRPPRLHLAAALQAHHLAQEKTIALYLMAQCRELLDPQRQQQNQKTHG